MICKVGNINRYILHECKYQERLSLSELTKKVLEEMEISISSLFEYRIIYIAHFFTAEWSTVIKKSCI